MDGREQRGLAIAALCRINERRNGMWSVPSQSGRGRYTVRMNQDEPSCTCPDHAETGCKCKHIYAVEFMRQREQHPDGSETVTDTVRFTAQKRTTYPQDWRAYNHAQSNEKDQFQELLHTLCTGIEELPPKGRGRPRLPIADAVFALAFKIYSTVSARRFMSDLRESHRREYLTRVPHFNSIFNYSEDPRLSKIITRLILESSRPLSAIETDFAADSTGFTTSRFVRWYDHKYDTVRAEHDWVKAHLMCGVKTNIVTAVVIRGRLAQDSPILPLLVSTTSKRFRIKEVSADKGYSSINNVNLISKWYGATPYIHYKAGHTGRGGGAWEKMFQLFALNRDEFMDHYHKRSNVESTVSMIKAKFRDHVRSKTDVAMKNEVLGKVLCHNICCIISAIHELGLDPVFWSGEPLLGPRRLR